jgi:hypothetical protein
LTSTPEYLRDIQCCRERLIEARRILAAKADREPSHDPSRGPGLDLFPYEANTLEATAQAFLNDVGPEELGSFDRQIQEQIRVTFGSLVTFCLDTGPRPEQFASLLDSSGCAHIESRLTLNDCIESILQVGRKPDALRKLFNQAMEASHPALAGPNAAIESLVTVIGLPATESGHDLRKRLAMEFPDASISFAEHPNSVVINRELQQLPLTDLPHMGPLGKSAYEQALCDPQTPPHSRFDVEWTTPRA